MEDWCPIAHDLIAASDTPKTKCMYEKTWQVYTAINSIQGVLVFIVHQREKGRSLSLVRRQLSAIAFFAGLQGVPDPTKDPRVKRAIKGWEHLFPGVKDRKRPIDASRLTSSWVCCRRYAYLLMRHSCLV